MILLLHFSVGTKGYVLCCDWWISIHLSVGLFLVSAKNATIGDFNIRMPMLLKRAVKTVIADLLLFLLLFLCLTSLYCW